MIMNRKRILLATGVALFTTDGFSGGIALYEITTPDVGLAAAGYAARAQDASTVYRNPAGMSLLEGSQFQGGLQLVYGSVEFSQDSNTGPLLAGSPNGGNAVGALPAGGLFFTHALSERFSVGFGTLSYFGLASQYDDGWVGRYYVDKGTLLGMSLMPAASFKATDWLSFGAGLNAMYGYMDTEVGVRTPLATGDGRMAVKDEVWGFGANVGVMIKVSEKTRFGATYLSPVKLDFADTPTFSNVGAFGGALLANPPELDLGVTVPQSVMVSGYHELSAKWALLANVGWQNWAQFGKVDIGVNSATPSTLTADLDYRDTWHGALGTQFRPSENWVLSGGVAYDSSPVSDEDRTLSLPVGEAYRFGVGAQWQVSRAIHLGAACELLWAGDLPVTQDSSAYQGLVSGGYNDTWFSFFTVNLTWQF